MLKVRLEQSDLSHGIQGHVVVPGQGMVMDVTCVGSGAEGRA